MITISEDISVPSPPERVWAVVSDPNEVVACIGGAELGESYEDGSFDGTLLVKFGAVRVKFGARVSLELDEPAREGHLSARGKDGQGATRFKADATFGVKPEGAGSVVHMRGEIALSGKLASLIEAGAGAVVSRMTKEFTDELIRRCGGEPEPAPARKPLLARIRDWWRRIVHKRQNEQEGVRSGKAQ